MIWCYCQGSSDPPVRIDSWSWSGSVPDFEIFPWSWFDPVRDFRSETNRFWFVDPWLLYWLKINYYPLLSLAKPFVTPLNATVNDTLIMIWCYCQGSSNPPVRIGSWSWSGSVHGFWDFPWSWFGPVRDFRSETNRFWSVDPWLLYWLKINYYPLLCKNFSFNWACSLFLMSCSLLLNEPKFWFSASFKPLWFAWPGTSDNLDGSHTIVLDRWFEMPWFLMGSSNKSTMDNYSIFLIIGCTTQLIQDSITWFHCKQSKYNHRLKSLFKRYLVILGRVQMSMTLRYKFSFVILSTIADNEKWICFTLP